MKGKMKKIIAGIATLAMVAQLGFVIPASAEATITEDEVNETKTYVENVDMSSWGSYDASTKTSTIDLTYANKSASNWKKFDLTPYTIRKNASGKTEQTLKVIVEYKEVVPSAGRTDIGFFDKDKANWAVEGYQDTAESAVAYGIMGGNTQKRFYVNSASNYATGTFAVDTEESVQLTFDLENKKISGNVGAHTIAETDLTALDDIGYFAIYCWSKCTYKVTDMKITTVVSTVEYFDVSYKTHLKTTNETIKKNTSPISVPSDEEAADKGYVFKGWTTETGADADVYDEAKKDTYLTNAQVKEQKITAETTYTAVYEEDPSYIEALESVEFVNPTAIMTLGADASTWASNNFTIKVTGEKGTDLYANPDSRVVEDPAKLPISYADGTLFIKYNVAKDAKLIIANYADGGTLSSVSIEDIALINGTKEVTKTLTNGTKVMVWDDVASSETGGMKPLLKGNAYTVNTDDDAPTRKIEWTFEGFRTFTNGRGATGDQAELATIDGVADCYSFCDGYGRVVEPATWQKTVDFEAKGGNFNFYGKITATVTYNGVTKTAVAYTNFIGDKTQDASVIVPKAGYISDFDNYDDCLVGYKFTDFGTDLSKSDATFGNWALNGSDNKSAEFMKDEETNEKFIRVWHENAKKSGVTSVNLGSTPESQVIFKQDVRFNSTEGSVSFTQSYPFYNDKWKQAFSASYANGTINLNGTAITAPNSENAVDILKNTWYTLVVSADPTTKKCWLNVYNTAGTLIGVANNVAYIDSDASPTYYVIAPSNNVAGCSLDFADATAYYPAADTSQFTLSAQETTLTIPETAEADRATTTLTASLLSTEGYEMTGEATWEITDNSMKTGVTLVPSQADSHTATLTVTETASSGELPVRVTIGGESKTIKINLTSSAENIKFTSYKNSISIPLDARDIEPVTFAAKVVDGNGADVAEAGTCTFEVYDRNNITKLTTLPTGITFENGVLTVGTDAQATTITIRANATNSLGEPLTRAMTVVIHGLSFDFGTGEEDDLVEGYTAITPSTAYDDEAGYGITGAATVGGEASTSDASKDYLQGSNITFKAKVQQGKIYNVTVGYAGVLTTENFGDGYITGHVRNREATDTNYTGYVDHIATNIEEQTFAIPVMDDVLDMNFTGTAKIAYVTIEKTADKEAAVKPTWYAIGDSTVGNRGNWGMYAYEHRAALDTENVFAEISNRGKGSRTSSSYVNQGWLDGVLTSIHPGDLVTISNMGTNSFGGSDAQFYAEMKYYADSCMALGAKVVLGSYTSHGPYGGYERCLTRDAETGNLVYAGNRGAGGTSDSYEIQIEKLAAYYEEQGTENYLGFVDIGAITDAKLTAIAQAADTGGDAGRTVALAALTTGNPYYTDHNHTTENFCSIFCPDLVKAVADIWKAQ